MTTIHTILDDLAAISTDGRDNGDKQGPAGLPSRLPAMVKSLVEDAEGRDYHSSVAYDGRLAFLRKG